MKVYDPKGMPRAREVLSGVDFRASSQDCCAGADCIVLATEWPEFLSLDLGSLANKARGRIFVDLRNAIDPEALLAAEFFVHGVGRRSRAPAAKNSAISPLSPPIGPDETRRVAPARAL